jgi:hypothetical protein
MLRKLKTYHNIGREPLRRDFVGVLSSHPFTIRAALRIFSRGIQGLDTSSVWDGKPLNVPHAPLRAAQCLPILESSPVAYVRSAQMNSMSEALSANTRFFIDHTVPRKALQLIAEEMHQYTRKSWRWYFGPLQEGFEYICVLQYRYVPSNVGMWTPEGFSVNDQSAVITPERPARVAPPIQNQASASNSFRDLPSYIDLHRCLIASEMIHDPPLYPMDTYRAIMAKQLYEANKMVVKHQRLVAQAMDGTVVPDEIWQLYSVIFDHRCRSASILMTERPMPWIYLKKCAKRGFPEGDAELYRLAMLQALHWSSRPRSIHQVDRRPPPGLRPPRRRLTKVGGEQNDSARSDSAHPRVQSDEDHERESLQHYLEMLKNSEASPSALVEPCLSREPPLVDTLTGMSYVIGKKGNDA